jgi:hypothetical protein
MTNEADDPDWSRNYRVRAGEDFYDAIWLTGYGQQSTWGYDTGTAGFFAQLWQNGTRTDNPELWLTAPLPLLHPECLVAPIVEHTGHDPLLVVRALGIAQPAPTLRTVDDLDRYAAQFEHLQPNLYSDGAITACRWLAGDNANAPLSQTRPDDLEHPSPCAAVVQAEAAYATGVVYQTKSDYAVGVETILVYATSKV